MDEVIAGVLGLLGASFTLLAGVGAVRFPDALTRMHAATKASTLGLLLIVVGAEFQVTGGSTKLAMAMGLVFLTAPVAAHLVGRSSYRDERVELRLDEVDELAEAEADELAEVEVDAGQGGGAQEAGKPGAGPDRG